MNITASPHSGVHAIKHVSVKPTASEHKSEHPTLGSTEAVGSPHTKDSLQLSDHVQPQHHALITPLKVLTLHGGIMAAEQGTHFMLGKVSGKPHLNSNSSGSIKTIGAVVGAAASGYLAYTAVEHAQHAAKAGHTKAAVAYSVSAVLDAGLAIANTLSIFKKGPDVSMGMSLGIGTLSTASAMWAAKLEQQAAE